MYHLLVAVQELAVSVLAVSVLAVMALVVMALAETAHRTPAQTMNLGNPHWTASRRIDGRC